MPCLFRVAMAWPIFKAATRAGKAVGDWDLSVFGGRRGDKACLVSTFFIEMFFGILHLYS